LRAYLREYEDEDHMYGKVLRQVLSGEDREVIGHLRAWLFDLEQLGVVDRETRDGEPYYRLLRANVPNGCPVTCAQLSRERIARLLVFNKPEITNELSRIAELAGYSCGTEFVNRLFAGDVPAHLGRAARWYLETRAREIPREYWPSWVL